MCSDGGTNNKALDNHIQALTRTSLSLSLNPRLSLFSIFILLNF